MNHKRVLRLLALVGVLVLLSFAPGTWASPHESGLYQQAAPTPALLRVHLPIILNKWMPGSAIPTPAHTSTPTSTPTPTRTPTPTSTPDSRVIVFTSLRDGNQEIYIINADGRNERRLTDHPALDNKPCISPDRSKIVFVSYRTWVPDLYTMDLDGSGLSRLTSGGTVGGIHDLFWSADGEKVFYTRYGSLYSVDPDGSNQHQIAATDGSWCYLSPDELKLAFIAGDDGNVHVLTIGGQDIALAGHPAQNNNPRWSPDSNLIVFDSYRDWSLDLWVVGVDDTGLRKLTNTSRTFNDGIAAAAWSPDGSKIAYSFSGTPWKGIYVVDSQGTNHRLAIASGHALQWYPDGESFVYASHAAGLQQICVADADGLDQRQLTFVGNNFEPSWAPY